MRLMPLIFAVLCIGCAPKTIPTQTEMEARPHLPSPFSNAYTREAQHSKDPVVAKIAAEKTWDIRLSGAAAGLAMGWIERRSNLEPWQVREALWQAGYAYPIQQMQTWRVAIGESPPESLTAWIADVPETADLGLVRARGPDGDYWVGLVANVSRDIGAQPRQMHLGSRLKFDALPGAEVIAASPAGGLMQVDLEQEQLVRLDLPGEWLFEVRENTALVARFPVYVDLVPPKGTVLTVQQAPQSADAAASQFTSLLNDVRAVYGKEQFRSDDLLRAAAHSVLDKRTTTARDVATKLGLNPNTTWRLECAAPTLEACADQLLWNPRARPSLLSATATSGFAAELVNGRIHVVVLISAP
ncbi:MAG: hypothetical protein GWP91_25840 [Rhodobacterales bacterium]|nr:hypothetical protein [Rhodobacterales bacterium]